MNSNLTSHSVTQKPSECQVNAILRIKLDETVTAAYAVHVFIIVLGCIACPLTTVLNLLVIISVKRKPQLKTISNTVLGCLAVTDALMGIIGLPLFVTSRILNYQGETSSDVCAVKDVFRSVLRILGGATVFHLTVMNVERYIAIKHPFQHTTIATKPRVLGSSALAWIAAFFTSFLLVITDYSINLTVVNVILLFSMAVIIYCQVVVYRETRRQEKLIAAQEVSVEAKKKFLKEKKAFKVTTTLLVMLLISYLPLTVALLVLKTSIVPENVAFLFGSFSTFVIILNSLTNPIIYCVRTRQFRVAFIEILLGKTNTQAEELERRVFGSANNNDNNNNDSQSHSNADNNNIRNNDTTDGEDNNNRNNNSDDNEENNGDTNSDDNNVNNNNSDDNKNDNSNNDSDDHKDNNDGNNSDNNDNNNNNSDNNNDDNNSDDNNVNNDDNNSDNNNGNENSNKNSDDNNFNNNNNNSDGNKNNNDDNNTDNNNVNDNSNNDNNNSDDNNINNDDNSDNNKDNSNNNINVKKGNNSNNNNDNTNKNIDNNSDNHNSSN